MSMHVDPMAVSHTAGVPWETFVITTIDHRRIEVTYNQVTGEHRLVERPTPRPGPRGPTPTP